MTRVNQKKGNYLIKEIIDMVLSEKIELPTVQRGFVWRPHQVENFWDSLLRGYPAGSFVFSSKENQNKLDLLDGQQRTTAIYLAFTNPNEKQKNKLKATTDDLQVFIDLGKPKPNDNRKYIFRVITKSHPWGYQLNENQKTLEAKKIKESQEKYKIKDNYLNTPLKNFWPYDAIRPVPFYFFLENMGKNSVKKIEESINNWEKETGYKRNETKSTELYSIKEILDAVQTTLAKLQIPAIYLDLNKMVRDSIEKENDVNVNEDSSDEEIDTTVESREISDVENLFIRLNAGGTPLRGEELNYSILKSGISNKFNIQALEKACEGMFSPARFVTLAFRLFQHSQNKANSGDALSMRIKVRQFQRGIQQQQNKNNSFEQYLSKIIREKRIEKLRDLLSYDSNKNKYGLPQFIYASLAERAPEVMFILLYRLWIKGDFKDFEAKDRNTDESFKKLFGIITMFLWFGRGNNSRRDYSNLLKNVSKRLGDTPVDFWSRKVITAASKKDKSDKTVLIRPVSPKHLKNLIPARGKSRYADVDGFKSKGGEYKEFISEMLYQRDLLLYAQRDSLHFWFSNINYSLLEDTNRPYDWDHIFPENWIRNKKNIKESLKQWYQTIGNFRAEPYWSNRSNQDDPPMTKLSIKKAEFEALCKGIGIKEKDIPFYSKNILCIWSACSAEWKNFGKMKEKNTEDIQKMIKAIRERAIDIYERWYKDLKIASLLR